MDSNEYQRILMDFSGFFDGFCWDPCTSKRTPKNSSGFRWMQKRSPMVPNLLYRTLADPIKSHKVLIVVAAAAERIYPSCKQKPRRHPIFFCLLLRWELCFCATLLKGSQRGEFTKKTTWQGMRSRLVSPPCVFLLWCYPVLNCTMA